MPLPADCVRQLAELAGVPADAHRVFDWTGIEAGIGLGLPTDYKLLAESFRSGWFRRFVRPRWPERVAGGGQRLLGDFAAGQLETMREWRAGGEGRFPYPVFPEPGGLLPWGGIRDGGMAFWLTGPGAPDSWPVVVTTQLFDYWDRFNGSVCEFLVEVAAGWYDASGFTEGPYLQTVNAAGQPTISGFTIDLAGREPVFEPDSRPVPPSASAPRVPSPDFWARRLEHLGNERRPVYEFAALRELIGSPPVAVQPVDWTAVHDRLGLALPADYRAFIDTYGPGTFGDIRITAPGAGEMDLFALLERVYRQVCSRVRYADLEPPFYPEPAGTICWGETTGGETCAWAPVGNDPGQWNTVAIRPGTAPSSFALDPGKSFSTVLKEHHEHSAQQQYLGLLPPRDPYAGPVKFLPYDLPNAS